MRPAVWGALLFSLILASCDLGPPVPGGAGPLADIGDCPSDESFFEHRVWAAVLSQSCQECHHAEGLAGDTALVLAPESDPQWLATNFAAFVSVAMVPEAGDTAPLVLTKPTGLHEDGHGGGTLLSVDSEAYGYLATLVGRLNGQIDECNNGVLPELDCEDEIEPGPRLLRRLSHPEYDATLSDLFGYDLSSGEGFAPDNVVGGYDNNATVLGVSSLLADQYRTAAEALAQEVVASHLSEVLGCDPASLGEAACARSFIVEFGARAFRRPLTGADVLRYEGLWSTVAAEDGFEVGIQWVITGMLQSPHFLYRSELGANAGKGRFVLSDWEIASELSYLLWGTMPDAELFTEAAEGRLSEGEARGDQIARMLLDPRAARPMEHFAERWLQYSRLQNVTRDEEMFPEFTAKIREAMLGETRRLISDGFSGGATLEDLFLGTSSPMTDELASYYGLPVGTGPADADGFRSVSLEGSPRLGLLSQGSILATKALPTSSSPIHRGLLVRERLLCQELPPPPANLDASPPAMDPELSTRERYADHSALPECAACHQLIDPIGFSFEHFDAVGRWRETEGHHSIDTTGEIVATAATDASFDGLAELSAVLATSSDVESCYVRQWMRFGFGLEEEGALRCAAEHLSDDFVAGGAHLADALPVLTGALHFTERLGDPSEGDAPAAGPFDEPLPDPVGDDDDDDAGDDDDDTSTSSEVIASLVIQSDWVAGYCADVTVENPLAVEVTWQIELEIEGTISSLWNAIDTPTSSGSVQFVGVAWNASIPAGQSTSFGFCADR
ncbi:MAG: DUF1592 domain-containing protein [Myxococcota bacterium]|nr:DUF1592 domain-containing protein [Myxococcota bacterium]